MAEEGGVVLFYFLYWNSHIGCRILASFGWIQNPFSTTAFYKRKNVVFWGLQGNAEHSEDNLCYFKWQFIISILLYQYLRGVPLGEACPNLRVVGLRCSLKRVFDAISLKSGNFKKCLIVVYQRHLRNVRNTILQTNFLIPMVIPLRQKNEFSSGQKKNVYT